MSKTNNASTQKGGAIVNTGGSRDLSKVERDIRESGIAVVNPKEVVAQQADLESILDAIANAKDAEEAQAILHRGAGIVPFANKLELARTGQSFSVRKLVIRADGGFNDDDDIAVVIYTQSGQTQVLTFEQNKGRNNFMMGLAQILDKFGEAPNWALQMIGSENSLEAMKRGENPPEGEKYFYHMIPAALWLIGPDATIHEGEYTVN